MMLAYTCQDQEDNALKISHYLIDFLNKWECKQCGKTQTTGDEDYVIGPDKEPYRGFCAETVKNSVALLKGIVRGSKLNIATRESILFTIDQFADRALNCCAEEALWRTCVGPLAKEVFEWRVLKVPPDPMWD